MTYDPERIVLPFENPQAESAPTRRSSRLRTAAVEAPAAGATTHATASSSEPTASPTSRRAARERLIAAALATSMTPPAVSPSEDVVDEIENVGVLETPSPEPADVPDAETAAPVDAPAGPESSLVDAFEQACAALRGSAFGPAATSTDERAAEASAPTGAAASPAAADEAAASKPHVVRRRTRLRKVVTLGATVGVMGIAGLLAVSMTLPAEAVAAVQGTTTASTSLVAADTKKSAADDEIQAFVTSSDVKNETLTRSDAFSTISMIDVAAEQGINYSNEIFTNDPEAAIQWPFLVGVGMSYGYGMRSGRLHEGIDFVPGNGAPVQAIADGTVRIATEQGGAYGVTVYIDHVIDGEVITSHYAHMQYGSLQVQTGDKVTVGTVIGKTGNTGRSYGAHMHFELIVNGSTIDPMPWLKANAGRYEY